MDSGQDGADEGIFSDGARSRVLRNLRRRQGSWRTYGVHHVFCRGCVVIGPVRSWWWLLEILSFVVVLTFIIEWKNYHVGVFVMGLILYLVFFISSWKTLLIDPGILKKGSYGEAVENAKDAIGRMYSRFSGAEKEMYVGGERVKHTYCFRCHLWRPPGSGHCITCKCCLDKWDHHCPVFGGCVAKRNFVSFHIMVVAAPVFFVYMLIGGIVSCVPLCQYESCDFLSCSFVADEVVVGIGLAFLLPPLLMFLPCEKDPSPDPPDNTGWRRASRNSPNIYENLTFPITMSNDVETTTPTYQGGNSQNPIL